MRRGGRCREVKLRVILKKGPKKLSLYGVASRERWPLVAKATRSEAQGGVQAPHVMIPRGKVNLSLRAWNSSSLKHCQEKDCQPKQISILSAVQGR